MSTKLCTVSYMTDNRSLDDFRKSLDDRNTRYRKAAERLTNDRNALRAVVLAAIAAGMSEAEAAKVTGLSRMTIRAWQGKK